MSTTPLPPPVPLTGLDCYIDPKDGKVKRYDQARADLEAENARLREALHHIEGVAMADEPRDLPGIAKTARAALETRT